MSHASLLLELDRKDLVISKLSCKVAEQRRTLERVLNKIHTLEESFRKELAAPDLLPVLRQKEELIKRLAAENASLRTALDYTHVSDRPASAATARSPVARRRSHARSHNTVEDLVNSFN